MLHVCVCVCVMHHVSPWKHRHLDTHTHALKQSYFQDIQATDHSSRGWNTLWLFPSSPLVSSFVIIQHNIHNMHFALQGHSPQFLRKEPLHQVDCFMELPVFPTVICFIQPAVILF